MRLWIWFPKFRGNANTYHFLRISLGKKTKLIITIQIILVAVMLGLIFVLLRFGFESWYLFVNATVIASISGLIISAVELSFMLEYSKRMKFYSLLLLKFFIYSVSFTLLLFNVSVISRMLRHNQSYLETIRSGGFNEYIFDGSFQIEVVFMLAFTFIINFTIMLNRKLGPGMMMAFIKGTYYVPRTQVRTVMFLKLKDSNHALKKLKPVQFHAYLNQVYLDITIPVLLHDGVIHEYIDDIMVVTWPVKDNLKLETCFNVFFEIQNRLKKQAGVYQKTYELVPQVYASLHIGSLVASEIGEIKTQIALLGDTLNTTARILQQCEDLDRGLIASRDIVSMSKLSQHYRKTSLGNKPLKGKQENVELFEISTKNP